MPRLSGRIVGFASALLVVGLLLIPAADARPDRTVTRAYRVIAPAYAVNTRGVGYAVWVEQDGNAYAVHGAYQAKNGRWTKERRISQPFSWGTRLEGLPGEPDVAVDDRGRATVVWAQRVGRAVKVFSAEGRKNRWSAPRAISGNNDLGMYPEVAVSPNGRHALASWTGNYLTVDAMTLMASTRTKAGTWTKPRQAIPTDSTYKPSSRQPPPVIDNHGTATVAWVEVERIPTPEGFVYGRIQSATARRGGAWVPEELYRGVPGAYAENVSLATSPEGGAAGRDHHRRLGRASCGPGGGLRRRCVGDARHGVPALAGNRPPGADRGGRSGRARSGPPGDADPDRPAELRHTAPPRAGGRPGGRLARRDRLGSGGHDRCWPRDPPRTLAVGPKGDIAVGWQFATAGSAWPARDRPAPPAGRPVAGRQEPGPVLHRAAARHRHARTDARPVVPGHVVRRPRQLLPRT